ncbi:hypothetical protein BJ322DRAFT_1104082 [Thelephora terrestris]|uniref:Uncharacterized protein n=1 Tax=Thelephora terrestris TaxID=56493 RepID=A0A9P6HNJ6_9AGAM|nr:hypothetical protein BJ322DRAFT_1104082 [Thelephora terrestris]
MPPNTHSASKKSINKHTQPVYKIKLTPQQVRSAFQRSVTEEENTAIKKVAILEAELCSEKEFELQEALTLPTVIQQVPAERPLPGSPTSGMEDQPSCHSDVERMEEEDKSAQRTPLFLSDGVDDRLSPARGDEDTWETESEWTGFGGNRATSINKDDMDVVNEPSPSVTKQAAQVTLKAKSKKPLMIRDLVKAQIHADNQSDTLVSKKRKLTNDGNRPLTKRVALKSGVMNDGGGLMIRPGFLDDDDAETIRRDRKAVIGQKGKSKSIVKVTHEKAPLPTAEEKRKKSNVAGCYLKDFNTKFVPELVKCVSDDANPWQPTFDTKFTQMWAIGIVKAYFGDKSIFGTAEEVEEHVQWLLPNKDEEIDEEDEGKDNDEDKEGGTDEEENVDVEEIV